MDRKTRRVTAFREKYGPWALVAGGSEGIGRAFAVSLAKRGLHLVLIGRTEQPLARLCEQLEREYHIDTLPLPQDLSSPGAVKHLGAVTADLEIGLVVYNAALADIGPFLGREPEMLSRLVAANCTGPLLLCRHFGERMAEGGRGGLILLSSMSGFQGTPYVAAYAASKAFNLVLAEGLWYELKSAHVDVLVCCPGATGTPGFYQSLHGKRPPAFPPVLQPQQVAEQSLRRLGKRSVLIPGFANRMASFVIRKLMPRRAAVRIMGKSTGRLYGRGAL